MKALILCTETDRVWGGRGEHVQQVAKRLPAHGVEPLLITVDGTWLGVPPCYTRSVQEVRNYFLPQTNEEARLSNQTAWIELAGEVARLKGCDIIQAHDWDAVMPGLILRRILGKPLVVSYHLFQHQLVTEMGQEETSDTTVAITEELNGLLLANHVTYCSKAMAEYAETHMQRSRSYSVLYNGVDQAEYSVKPFKRDRPVILFCGRLCDQKGVDIFLNAAESVGPARFEWVVMGKVPALENDAASTDKHLRRVRELEAKGVVTYLGHLYGEEKRRWIKTASLVVVPSRKEPFGIIALEAMAAGVPLATTRVDGLAEFCNEGNSFLLGDIKEVIWKLPLWEQFHNASETVAQFTWDKTAAETAEIFKRVAYAQNCTAESRA